MNLQQFSAKKCFTSAGHLVEDGKEFNFFGGKSAHSISELALLLKSLPDSIYSYHVNNGRNDFAVWIRDVFNNDPLAASVGNAKDKAMLITILEGKNV